MNIDCKKLACPGPVLKAKKALLALKEGELLNLIVDNEVAKENVSRFLKNQGLDPIVREINQDEFEISALFKKQAIKEEEFSSQVLFLKSDKIGEGELGSMLMQGFLSNILELTNKPELIICVNKAVLINTDIDNKAHLAMKELNLHGIEIISCSACLQYLQKEPLIGISGNAYEILCELFSTKKVLCL